MRGLPQLLGRTSLLGNVLGQNKLRGPVSEGDWARYRLDQNHGPVPLPMPASSGRLNTSGFLQRRVFTKCTYVIERPNILNRQAQKLLPRVSVVGQRGLIHGDEIRSFVIEDPRRQGVVLKQKPVLLF